MRETRFECDRGDASLDKPGHRAPFYHAGLGGVGSVLGASAFAVAIAILWGIVPIAQHGRPMQATTPSGAKSTAISRLWVPPGSIISLYASRLGEARLVALTKAGDIVLDSPGAKVLLVRADRDRDGRADGVTTLLDGLGGTHDLVLDRDWLYVADATGVFRVRFDATDGRLTGPREAVSALPKGRRSIGNSPETLESTDGAMYVADDFAGGSIWRIVRRQAEARARAASPWNGH